MFLTVTLFIIGFYILLKGADLLVSGTSSIAARFRVSPFLIGLLVVGIGTSIPEFATFSIAHLLGDEHIGVGTIIGSNTFNILFILGAIALFFPLAFKKEWVERDLLWNIVSVGAVMVFSLWFTGGVIARFDGFLLLGLFLYWLLASIKTSPTLTDPKANLAFQGGTLLRTSGLLLAGLFGVLLGGTWVVDGAVAIAKLLGMSERIIGLTVVGIGTSLPEITASFVAAYRKEPGIAIGNIIGSNIFDFLMIFGFGALAKPIMIGPTVSFDLVITLFATILLYGSMFIGKKYTLKSWQGLLFVFLYGFYFWSLLRGA